MSRGFWSDRRARVAAEDAALRQAEEEQAAARAAQEEAAALKDLTDAEVLEKLNLPDPDSLRQGDDFGAFMARAVPEHLRRRALRRLWTSNPVLACVDGLNDYDGDFTGGGVPVGSLKTAYQVGRGFVQKVAEITEHPEETTANAASDAPEVLEEKETLAASPVPAAQKEQAPAPVPRRRMQFAFDDAAGDSDEGET